MAFKQGDAKKGGRVKGTPNKTTVLIKNALADAFEDLGGVSGLVTWGRENPTEFYKLWVKVLPAQEAEKVVDTKPIEVIIKRAGKPPQDD